MSVPAGEQSSGIVSVPELIDYMSGISLTENQKNAAAAILFGVQQELELFLHRPVQLLQVREVISPDRHGVLNTSVSPVKKVINIESVPAGTTSEVEKTPYVPEAMERDPSTPADARMEDWAYTSYNNVSVVPGGIRFGSYGYPSYLDYGYPVYGMATYLVEYIGGYDGYVDESLKLAIKRVAAREMVSNHDDTLSLRGDQASAAQASDERNPGWSYDELLRFDRLRRRVMA